MKPFLMTFSLLCFTSAIQAAPLHDAARDGDIKAVRALIEEGADVNAADDSTWQRTPLMLAAMNGHALVARALLENGASAQPEDEYEETPLRRVVQNTEGDQPSVVELVNVLLANGADPDRDRDYNGRTPVVWALLAAGDRPPLITAAILDGLLGAGAECVASIDSQFEEGKKIRMRDLAEKAGGDVLRVWNTHCPE